MAAQKESTLLTSWSGHQYTRAGLLLDSMTGPDFDELDDDQKLRLALFAANEHAEPEQLADLIETEADAYRGEWESGAELAEDIATEMGEYPEATWLVIDWEASWERNLRHDYFEYDVRHEGEYRRFFWAAY